MLPREGHVAKNNDQAMWEARVMPDHSIAMAAAMYTAAKTPMPRLKQ